jgi:hypothetical protein
MVGKIHYSALLLHIYIVSYLVVIVLGVTDNVMQIMHFLAPVAVIPFIYHTIKSALYVGIPEKGARV